MIRAATNRCEQRSKSLQHVVLRVGIVMVDWQGPFASATRTTVSKAAQHVTPHRTSSSRHDAESVREKQSPEKILNRVQNDGLPVKAQLGLRNGAGR